MLESQGLIAHIEVYQRAKFPKDVWSVNFEKNNGFIFVLTVPINNENHSFS